MNQTSRGLSENIRFKAIGLLNRHLAAAIDLHAPVKQTHWDLRGPAFFAIYELFGVAAKTKSTANHCIGSQLLKCYCGNIRFVLWLDMGGYF